MRTLLIVGLGNPGQEYAGTRHNIGRETVRLLQKKAGLPDFRFEKKWNAEVSEGKIGKVRIAALLPDTFVNKSGEAVAPAVRFYKTKKQDIFLIHDDADIELGRAKMSFAKHSAGHKGVESVIRALKGIDFWRFRIGIAGRRDIPAEKLVLKKLTSDEQVKAKKAIKKTVEAITVLGSDSPEKVMGFYNSS